LLAFWKVDERDVVTRDRQEFGKLMNFVNDLAPPVDLVDEKNSHSY
jgi:hypothetical protein